MTATVLSAAVIAASAFTFFHLGRWAERDAQRAREDAELDGIIERVMAEIEAESKGSVVGENHWLQ